MNIKTRILEYEQEWTFQTMWLRVSKYSYKNILLHGIISAKLFE